MKEEREFLSKLLKDKTVIVSCSGGPDSMALLSLVNSIKDEYNIKVVVAHVNHKVREESDEEALMVETYAEEYHDDFELFVKDAEGYGFNIDNRTEPEISQISYSDEEFKPKQKKI